MRAVLVKADKGPIENLYVGQVEKPVQKDGQVVVKVSTSEREPHRQLKLSSLQIVAFGLNRMDLLQREGHYPLPPGASTILGVEFAGYVEQLGPGVTKWAIGDEVFGLTGGVSIVMRHATCPFQPSVSRVHMPSTLHPAKIC